MKVWGWGRAAEGHRNKMQMMALAVLPGTVDVQQAPGSDCELGVCHRRMHSQECGAVLGIVANPCWQVSLWGFAWWKPRRVVPAMSAQLSGAALGHGLCRQRSTCGLSFGHPCGSCTDAAVTCTGVVYVAVWLCATSASIGPVQLVCKSTRQSRVATLLMPRGVTGAVTCGISPALHSRDTCLANRLCSQATAHQRRSLWGMAQCLQRAASVLVSFNIDYSGQSEENIWTHHVPLVAAKELNQTPREVPGC